MLDNHCTHPAFDSMVQVAKEAELNADAMQDLLNYDRERLEKVSREVSFVFEARTYNTRLYFAEDYWEDPYKALQAFTSGPGKLFLYNGQTGELLPQEPAMLGEWLYTEAKKLGLPEIPEARFTWRVPSFEQLLGSLPRKFRDAVETKEWDEGKWARPLGVSLRYWYDREIESLLRYCRMKERAVQVGEAWERIPVGAITASMGFFQGGETQQVATFNVYDAQAPLTGRINFHGQDLSTSLYAGGLAITEDRSGCYSVSTHH